MKRCLIALMLASACGAATAQYSAASSYMNTVIMNRIFTPPAIAKSMREQEARLAAQSNSAPNTTAEGVATPAAPVAAAAPHAELQSTDVTPDAAVRAAVAAAVLNKVPAGPKRDQMRQGLEMFGGAIESSATRPNNVAQMAYILLGLSVRAVGGKALDASQSDALVQKINDALANDPNFSKMDAAQRTNIYYALLTTAAATFYLANSPTQDEARAGKALAASTLKSFGFKL